MASPEKAVDGAGQLTHALRQWSGGDRRAGDHAFGFLYRELHRTAAAYFRHERPGHTLQPTALISETFLRLQRQSPVSWQDRKQFLGCAARVMRQVLVDHARTAQRQKRGRGVKPVALSELDDLAETTPQGILALHEALEELGSSDPQKARVVELRFFGGLEYDEIAELMAISRATVGRQIRRSRAWLYWRLTNPADDQPEA